MNIIAILYSLAISPDIPDKIQVPTIVNPNVVNDLFGGENNE